MEGYGTYMSLVVEISLDRGRLQVHRVVCTLDRGQVVNPSIVTAPVEGAVIFGLTAELWGEINLKGARRYRGARHRAFARNPSLDTASPEAVCA